MKKIFSIISAVAVLMAGTTACDSYLDINYDPNAPASDVITADLIFPGIEMAVATSYGNYLRIVGGYYSQVYSQTTGTSNYLDYSQFKMSPTRCSGMYSQFYQKGLQNIKTVQALASESGDKGTFLAATVLKAFIYQALVDCFGEVPYSEALSETNITPKYDSGLDIYKGIVAELESALDGVLDDDYVCVNFLFPDQVAAPWIEFANALELRILMRMSGVENVDDAVARLIARNRFPSEDIALAGCWEEAAGKESPFYGEEFSSLGGSTQKNLIANVAIVGSMQIKDPESGEIVYADGRLAKFFEPNASGEYTGGISGTNFSTADEPYKSETYWNRPVASFDMPVTYISVAETEFFLSEYYASKGNKADAQTHYDNAIVASFASAGANGAAEHLAEYPFDYANYKSNIGVQKWMALSGVNTFEAYCEVRRLGYPDFGTVKGSDMYSGSGAANLSLYVPFHLYTPYQVFGSLGENKILERFPYAESSESRNPNCPEFPGYDKPIFWGVKQ